MKSLLISVRSDLAEKEVSGEKPWEIRKKRPSVAPSHVIIYAKSPVAKVIGYCKLKEFIKFSQSTVQASLKRISVKGIPPVGHIDLSEFLQKVCINIWEFDEYFKGNKAGWIFELTEPTAIAPVKLPFHPPQQWQYFDGHPETIIQDWRRSSMMNKL